MDLEEFEAIIELCNYPGYTFRYSLNGTYIHIYASYEEPDTTTGETSEQITREWSLSLPNLLPSQVVSTAFLCIMTSMEHRAREWFTYRGRDIYGPHHDAEALYNITPERN